MGNKNFFYAVSTLIGTSIGAGIFGLPYVIAHAGFLPGVFMLIFLDAIILLINLIYGEITLRTEKKHRLVGYAEKYLGKNGKVAALFCSLFILYGSILAYIIISGQFLNSLFSGYFGGNEFIYSLISFAFVSTGIYFDLRVVKRIESLMTVFLLIVMGMIFFKGMPFIKVDNLLFFNQSQLFLPFGAILFSLGAMSAIPELEHILKSDQKKIKNAVVFGNLIPLILYIVFVSAGIYFDLRVVKRIESLMTVFLLIVMGMIFFKGLPFIKVDNLLFFNQSQLFLPFGAILFSLGAMSAIPELEHILKSDQKKIKSAVVFGNLIPLILYIVFVLVIIGTSGAATSEEALSGFSLVIGDGVATIGFGFGILAIITSFLIIGVNLKEMFMYDYGIGKKLSWFLTCSIPLIIFALGIRDFIEVINFVGGIAGGLSGILVILIYLKIRNNPKLGDLKPAYQIKIPKIVLSLMIFVFVLGIVYQLVY